MEEEKYLPTLVMVPVPIHNEVVEIGHALG